MQVRSHWLNETVPRLHIAPRKASPKERPPVLIKLTCYTISSGTRGESGKVVALELGRRLLVQTLVATDRCALRRVGSGSRHRRNRSRLLLGIDFHTVLGSEVPNCRGGRKSSQGTVARHADRRQEARVRVPKKSRCRTRFHKSRLANVSADLKAIKCLRKDKAESEAGFQVGKQVTCFVSEEVAYVRD